MRALLADPRTEIPWPGLLQCLLQLSIHEDPGRRLVAYRVFTMAPDIVEHQHQDVIYQAFSKGFGDSVLEVRPSLTAAAVSLEVGQTDRPC
jgi:hypothetical protein